MKRYILFFVFISSFIYSQAINSIQVTGYSGTTLTQSRDAFNNSSLWWNSLTQDATILNGYIYNYASLSPSPTGWGAPMLSLSLSVKPKFTAEVVRAYAIAWRYEENTTRKDNYRTLATEGAEFLLWLQKVAGDDGGIPDLLENGRIATELKGPHTTGAVACALYECYMSFGDTKYKLGLKKAADWEIDHPCYPFNYSFPENDFWGTTGQSAELRKKVWYGRINHMARALENLANAYKVIGDQKYLDRAIQIAEEIIAWQDQNQSGNCWASTSQPLPDGSWWWECRNPNPSVAGAASSPDNGFSAVRKIDYHCLTLDGLIALLESTQQQILPGTTTVRNSVSFISFRNNLISAIKKGVNYIIDNQETDVTGSKLKLVRGLIKSNKLHYTIQGTNTLYQFDNSTSTTYNSAPHGLSTIIGGYLSLLKTNTLSTQDISRLETLINTISSNLVGRYEFNWGGEETESVLLLQWAKMMNYKSLSSITSTLSLVNSGFEGTSSDKDVKWELWSWNGGGVTVSNNFARTGANSIRLLDNDVNAGMWAEQMITGAPGTTYKAEAYARIINSRQSLYLLFYDSDFNLLDFDHAEVWANSTWEKVTVQKTAPANTAYTVIKAHADWYWTSDGYWDDFSLTIVTQKRSEELTNNEMPVEYSLDNFPNPFNPATKIQYSLKHSGNTKLQVYDVTGSEVAVLVNGFQEKGKHEVEFDASKLSSGIYFYSIQSGEFVQTKKMMLVK